MLVARGGNNAVSMNPSDATGNLTTHGSDFYWAFFALFALLTIGYVVFGSLKAASDRAFYYIFTTATAILAITYFTLASDLGWTAIAPEFTSHQSGGTREIFYARFIGEFFTLPLVVLAPLLLSDLLYSQIGVTLFAAAFAIVMRLIGALIQSQYKWGYYAFSIAAFAYVSFVLLGPARAGARRNDVTLPYLTASSTVVFIETLYYIAWALSEGANVISLDSEAVFYGVLDLILVPVVGAWLIWNLRDTGLEKLGLRETRGSGLNATTERKSGAPRASDATAAGVASA